MWEEEIGLLQNEWPAGTRRSLAGLERELTLDIGQWLTALSDRAHAAAKITVLLNRAETGHRLLTRPNRIEFLPSSDTLVSGGSRLFDPPLTRSRLCCLTCKLPPVR